MPAKQIKITGSVQGVFFRAETQSKAKELKLTGWVKNCDDSSVEIYSEGSDESLKELEQWCHRGPPAAEVENIEVTESAEEHSKSFEIRY